MDASGLQRELPNLKPACNAGEKGRCHLYADKRKGGTTKMTTTGQALVRLSWLWVEARVMVVDDVA